MSTLVFPGGSNTYIRTWNSGDLMVQYSRNPKGFAVGRYVGYKYATRDAGLYLVINNDESARVKESPNYAWPAGSDRPTGVGGTEYFKWEGFKCDRYSYSVQLDQLCVDQAQWPIVDVHSQIKAAQAMTNRSLLGYGVWGTSGNWGSNTSAMAGSGSTNPLASGQTLTTTEGNIRKIMTKVREYIWLSSRGGIPLKSLTCTINPTLANIWANSAELINYVKAQETSPREAMGTEGEFFAKWSIPRYYAGVRIEVEDAVRVSTPKGGTQTAGYIMPSTVMLFTVVNTGSLEKGPPADADPGDENKQVAFNTVTCFIKEDLAIETQAHAWNRKTDLSVVDHIGFAVTAPATGWLLTGVS